VPQEWDHPPSGAAAPEKFITATIELGSAMHDGRIIDCNLEKSL
jgi:hypothetical protein